MSIKLFLLNYKLITKYYKFLAINILTRKYQQTNAKKNNIITVTLIVAAFKFIHTMALLLLLLLNLYIQWLKCWSKFVSSILTTHYCRF